MSDPLGAAIADFFEYGEAPDILIHTSYTEGELLSPAYFFRNETGMPSLERTALDYCRGKVLDAGAAAGCHALVLQEKGFEVTAIDRSERAVEVMRKRGVQRAICRDLFHFQERGFDTILLLMNGTGIGQTISGLQRMLVHLRSLLSEGGQILVDSADIHYLFEEDDGSVWVDLVNTDYYGEMDYELRYKDHTAKFKWLFTDEETLAETARKCGLQCDILARGDQNDFLGKLKAL